MSPPRARSRRAAPARTRPIRNPARHAGTGALGDTLATAGRLVDLSGRAVRGTVECGVETAYLVIEEYIRRGREAASRYAPANERRSEMNDDRRNATGAAMWGPMWPFVAPWMQAVQAWTEAAAKWPGMAGGSTWPPPAAAPAAAGAAAPAVSVLVSSHVPTEVSAALLPGADTASLIADPLAPVDDAGAPPLVGISFASTPGQVRVSLVVPTDQPSGRYRGSIRQAGGTLMGELTVAIAPPPGSDATTSP